MPQRIYQVDAFTDRPFTGNPAGVCLLTEARSDLWMQSVAAEMNLAETAFLVEREDGFALRWFTPTVEVDLCGHATLASAHILWETGYLSTGREARFHTRSGLLTARHEGGNICLDFPVERPSEIAMPGFLPEALGMETVGAAPVYCGRNRFDYLVEIASEGALRRLRPDFVRIATLPARGVIVTSRSESPDFDFVSRFFAPAVGVDEDPVTGSAHCCLAPYWAEKLGKSALVGYQASRRGGTVHVRLNGDRVALTGKAVTVLKADLCNVTSFLAD